MWNSEQHKLTPNYDIRCSLVPTLKLHNLNMEENYNQFKFTCQYCNGFVTCSGRSVEMIYITFLCAEISTLWIYLEELVP